MKPNEDYAGLIARLRKVEPDLPGDRTRWHRNPDGPDAADALEALLADRDALKAENERMKQSLPLWAHKQMAANSAIIERLRAERNALRTRLAPVGDEVLEAKAAAAIIAVEHNGIDDEFILEARAAIAAVRPHIEAAERERCARIADKYEGEWHSDTADACARAIAAAIRSGK